MAEQVIEKSYAEQIADKKKKKRIIISIVSLSLVFMIALIVIVMACVKIDLKPTVIKDPTRIYFNSQTTVQYDESTDEYKEFMEEYNKTFNISYLSALFMGQLGGYEIIEDQLQTLPEEVTENTYVNFLYKNEKVTLTKQDGKTYYSKYNSNYSIDFTEVTFLLSSENKTQDMTIYLKYNWNTTGSGAGKNYYAEIKLKANTYNLYKIYENL